ncbi:MAG: Gmad2 immunoglobulin-like domain-containing protein [bacterium]|nr:Gmad2 immunoglobulin-like domain-containing protein [bacterium]
MKNKIILSLLLVCALAMPVFAKAISVNELQALIAQLQAQIQALQIQLQQTQGQQPVQWCHTFNTNLGIGSNGEEVAYLQTALEKEGLYQSQGKFGYDENIASVVVGFQQKYASEILSPVGLKYGTGYLGKSTRAKLNKMYGCGNNPVTNKSITVSAPVAGQIIKSPVTISGKAVAFEGQFHIKIKDNNGVVLLDINTMGASSYGDPIPFSGQFTYNTPTAQNGIIEVFEFSAKDGSEVNKVSVLVSFGDYQGKNTCADTDGGKSYYNIGSIYDSGKTFFTDYCMDSSKLKEYFCLPYSSSGLGGPAEEIYTCPNGCSNGACIALPVQNSIDLYPGAIKTDQNGFTLEVWNVGTKTPNSVYDQVKMAGVTAGGYMSSDQMPKPGGYGIVRYEYSTFNNPTPGATYSLIFTVDPKNEISEINENDNVKTYNIVIPQKSITVVSPNGGEQVILGQTYTIKWNSTGVDKVGVLLIDYLSGGTRSMDISASLSNQGVLYWGVSQNTVDAIGGKVGDNYKIRVYELKSDGTIGAQDDSDNYFTFASSTTSVTCTDSDGGKSYYTKGTTLWGPISGKTYDATDGCDTAGKTLSERYCSNGYSAVEYYTCPNGCFDGACKNTQAVPTITSSKNLSLSSQVTVEPGFTNSKIASFIITAGNAEGMDVNSIVLQLATSSNQYIQNVRLYKGELAGGTQIGYTVGGGGVLTGSTNYTVYPNPALRFSAGQQIVLNVYADILTGAPIGNAGKIVLTKLTSVSRITNLEVDNSTNVAGQSILISQ